MSATILSVSLWISQGAVALAMCLCVYRMVVGPRAQDRILALDALYVCAMLLLLAFGVSARFGGERSVDVDRLRIAEVTRGTLVRDASVNGRVVAAVTFSLIVLGAIGLALIVGLHIA